MPLHDRTKMPAGGFFYREETLGWQTPNPYLPFNMIVQQIQNIRVANVKSGLNPTTESCARDLEAFTCKRLNHDPRWCHPASARYKAAALGVTEPRPKCAGCGGKRKRKN